MQTHFFITGTGTNVGKTFVTCALVQQLLKKHGKVHAFKPLVSGWQNDATSDTHQLLKAMGKPVSQACIDRVSPWRFKAPLAPHVAAQKEGKEYHVDEVVTYCQQQLDLYPNGKEFVLIEGAGGVMSPVTATTHQIDWIRILNIPIILVCGSYVGSVSHTLTALAACQLLGVRVAAIVINESIPNQEVTLEETYQMVKNLVGTVTDPYPLFSKLPYGEIGMQLPDLTSLICA